MKSICFVTTGDLRCLASAKRALGLAKPLSDLGWSVSILLQDSEENRIRARLETDERVRVEYFEVGRGVWSEIRQKASLVKALKPGYLYVCGFVARNLVRPYGGKLLVEHSELQSEIADAKALVRLRAYFLEYMSVLCADGLLNASQTLQDIFLQRARRLLRGGLPQLHFPYAYTLPPGVQPEPRRRAGDSPFVFLYVGSVVRNYGSLDMVEAFALVHARRPATLLRISGIGSGLEQARVRVADLNLSDCVQLPGFVPEEQLPEAMSMSDCFLAPIQDTIQDRARCPSKLYMYIQFRRPIITCRLGEPAVALGDKGRYYEPGNVESFAAEMLRVVDERPVELGIDPQLFTWSARAAQLCEWLQSGERP